MSTTADNESGKAHRHLVRVARPISNFLAETLRDVGPLILPDRTSNGLTYFLGRTVVGQGLSTHAARTIWSRILSASERPAAVADCFTEDSAPTLRGFGISKNKVRALLSLGRARREGRLRDGYLRNLSHEQRSQDLVALWGVGQWTCDMASMFYFGFPDVWPDNDVTVKKTFARMVDTTSPASTAQRFRHIAHTWR